MIVGTGVDITEVARIRAAVERFGERFLNRVFTSEEVRYCTSRPNTAERLAARFAAKEAFSKAIGTGFNQGVFLKDIGVVNLPSGAPTLALTGGAKAKLDAMTPPGHAVDIHVTLTDDHPWAQAFVILYARPI